MTNSFHHVDSTDKRFSCKRTEADVWLIESDSDGHSPSLSSNKHPGVAPRGGTRLFRNPWEKIDRKNKGQQLTHASCTRKNAHPRASIVSRIVSSTCLSRCPIPLLFGACALCNNALARPLSSPCRQLDRT